MSEKEVARTSEIVIRVGLNEQNIPVHLEWESSDGKEAGKRHAAKALLMSVFDRETLDTLKIDLWSEDFQVMEMDRFMFQTLRGLADTYFRATQNKDLALAMQQFVAFFGEQTGIIPQGGGKKQ